MVFTKSYRILSLLFVFMALPSISFAEPYACMEEKSGGFDVSNKNKLQLFFEKRYILKIDKQKPLITGDDIFFGTFNTKCFREDQFIMCFNNYGGFIRLDVNSGRYTLSRNRIVDGPDGDDPGLAFGKCEKF
jgi:hypothetical protein